MQVTITLTDNANGNVDVKVTFDPPQAGSAELTQAVVSAMFMVQALRNAADKVDEEGDDA